MLGPSGYLAKLDLADAFKHIPVHPEDCSLLGSTWYGYVSETNSYESLYYVDHDLMFGGKSSPRLFYYIVAAFVMRDHAVSYCDQYLDDFITAVDTEEECDNNLQMMLQTCSDLGFGINPQKVCPSTTCIESLGTTINRSNM